MSEGEGFAARWSRLKREKDGSKKGEPKTLPADAELGVGDRADLEATRGSLAVDEATEVPFDPTTLPTIDSIVADSDIRAFLQSGVPAELTKAALRRAWTTDPAIRDFIGLAENQWDFTDPTSIPGFGPMQAGDDIGKLVAQAMGQLPEPPETPPVGMTSTVVEAPSDAPIRDVATPQVSVAQHEISAAEEEQQEPAPQELAALQHEDRPPTDSSPNRRGHGRALPK